MSTNPPVKTFRHGRVSCAVFRHDVRGEPRYACTFERRYRDSETGEWHGSQSMSLWDLYSLMRCIADCAAYLTLREDPSIDTPAPSAREFE